MRHLKQYENLFNEPKKGDYVIYKDEGTSSEPLDFVFDDFVASNIGIISKIVTKQIDNEYDEKRYGIKYNNIPKEIFDYFNNNIRTVYRSEIIYFSPNKEDVEMQIKANKYNI